MRYRAAGVRDGLRGAGRKGRTLYYQRASCDCLRWLVRYPVCHLRQRLCQHGSQYAGNGGDSDFYLYQLYRLGRYHAADGLRRFKGLKWLNYIAVPLLVIVCLYGLIAGIVTNDGGSAITNYAPENSSGMVFGISMVVASFALGGVISADYCRFAKSRSDVVKSSVVGVIPAGLFMLLTGALMSIVTGQYDISAILASLGVPFVGLVALVLATWTTNVTNAYSGGLASAISLALTRASSRSPPVWPAPSARCWQPSAC